jgi:hypothetical protein
MPRQTHMVFRDKASLSAAAQQFVEVVSRFHWDASPVTAEPARERRTRPAARRARRVSAPPPTR